MEFKKINSALISVFNKEGLDPIIQKLNDLGVKIYSTGGTQSFIEQQNIPVTPVEELTSYPSILGGRVKTLHPKIFGGILSRRSFEKDQKDVQQFEIPAIDLVIVDLYPFEDTVASGASHEDIIEKIDIGGISLIRAAAKNYQDVCIVSNVGQYSELLNVLSENNGSTSLEQRKHFAKQAFHISSHYDTMIHGYFAQDELEAMKVSVSQRTPLRYGENPHQKGVYFGELDAIFEQLHGKEMSYNNLLDIDAAVQLMSEFQNDQPTFAILKHNNACGIATRSTVEEAYEAALAADPVSAFGGILISNKEINEAAADRINGLFCEVVIAPGFSDVALEILQSKKNRILLVIKTFDLPNIQYRSILNGFLAQEKDNITDKAEDFKVVTKIAPSSTAENDLVFAAKIAKHTKSNTIVIAKNGQLLASGTGQTSRVDALKQAIHKAKSFGFDLKDSVMASDAFFPFPDCVEIAQEAGISSVVQPGGSVKDQLSIDYCDANGLSMVFTGVRHFKH
jgi:phosphoribosylaminoimidazolecarboxamide formyltransferase/IMP cyclohydrolase